MTDKAPIVYVVDDESVIATTLAVILTQSGFSAKPFSNPLDALSAMAEQPPRLVITDVVMPEMTGIELAIRVRELQPNCKILLFSGQAATADLLADAQEKGHDFTLLAKPVHPKDLLEAIKSVSN